MGVRHALAALSFGLAIGCSPGSGCPEGDLGCVCAAGDSPCAGSLVCQAGTCQQPGGTTAEGSGSTEAAVCNADPDYGDAMLAMPQALVMGGGAAIFGASGLNLDADVLQLELFDGLGVFAGGIATGTFTIQGAELSYETCGVCLRILTDFDGMAFSDDGYLATGGTVDIRSIAGNLTYTASNVTFEHVTIDPTTFASTPDPDMCMSALTSASFDAVLN